MLQEKQDKERLCERDGKNCKAGRQTLGHKATLVWTREEERRRCVGERMQRWQYLEMDLVKEDTGMVGAREGDEVDRVL